MKTALRLFALTLLLGISCTSNKPIEVYQKFDNQSWHRYRTLKFEIPLNSSKQSYDIILFAHITKVFEFETLDFNMVMNTPSGEERINEYQLKIKSSAGSLLGKCNEDYCIYTSPLKKGISITEAGVLKIELENLTPRIETKGIVGIGVRLLEVVK